MTYLTTAYKLTDEARLQRLTRKHNAEIVFLPRHHTKRPRVLEITRPDSLVISRLRKIVSQRTPTINAPPRQPTFAITPSHASQVTISASPEQPVFAIILSYASQVTKAIRALPRPAVMVPASLPTRRLDPQKPPASHTTFAAEGPTVYNRAANI